MTHWSCTKQRIKQGHFETIQKEMKHGKKAHYFYRCFVSCSNCNAQVSPALGSVVPASCLERLSSASSTARAWQLLPWDLRGWGSKNLAADGSICTSNPPGKNLPPSSSLKLKIEDEKLLPPHLEKWQEGQKEALARCAFLENRSEPWAGTARGRNLTWQKEIIAYLFRLAILTSCPLMSARCTQHP